MKLVRYILTETGFQLDVVYQTNDGDSSDVGGAGPVNDSIKCIVINDTGTNLPSCERPKGDHLKHTLLHNEHSV